jgi:RHS repeat-associated protein
MTVTGQPTVTYVYDNANRLTQITQGTSTVSITYDGASRRSTLTLPNGVIATYGYDGASRLNSLIYTKGPSLVGNLIYTYDAAGRRIQTGGSLARTGLPQPITSASYNAANQLMQWNGLTLSYDANGNMITDGTNTYAWNARNQLISITGSGLAASFQYDSNGRRVNKSVNGAASGFLYDGGNTVQELSGGSPSANLLTGFGLDEMFTRTDSTGTSNFLVDGSNSTLALLDGTAMTLTQLTYEPFGKTTATGATSGSSFQFTGRENDSTGLYYYRARYYSPTLQRFISEDPLQFSGRNVNLFEYVFSDPINHIDPSGTQALPLSPSPGSFPPVVPFVPGGRSRPCRSMNDGCETWTPPEILPPLHPPEPPPGWDKPIRLPIPVPTRKTDGDDMIICTYAGEFSDPSVDPKWKICSYSCSNGMSRNFPLPITQSCPSIQKYSK